MGPSPGYVVVGATDLPSGREVKSPRRPRRGHPTARRPPRGPSFTESGACPKVPMARIASGRTVEVVRYALAALLLALLIPAAAVAAPPANDDRANAAVIPSFPAAIDGTTVDATVERLDPQVSQCGGVESTLWYRINQAPDGTIVLGVQGAGLAPVLRVYPGSASLKELVCSSAKAGAKAQVAFATNRGASYLVLVGKRPGTADAAFRLSARLFLPPGNDARGGAVHLPVPGTVHGSTLGATGDSGDPDGCDLAGGTVWYSIAPGTAARIVLRLQAAGDLDAAVVVLKRIRSQTRTVTCAQTDKKGIALAPFEVEQGAQYLVVVGQISDSPPGDFVLQALAAQPPEKPPGQPLPAGGARSTVNGLTDVNDVWWVALAAGTPYRIVLSSTGCPTVSFRGPFGSLRAPSCNGYSTFTPGPDGGGKYVLEVTARPGITTSSYRLRVAVAGVDDVGVGLELQNLTTAHGTLSPQGVDVVDLYHFDVAQASDVLLRLGKPSNREFRILLLTDTGDRVAGSADKLRRRLDRGRYVVAVSGRVGTPGGRYALSLVVRQLTKTTLAESAQEITPGASISFTVGVSPAPDDGTVELQIDRFDVLTGWQFNQKIRVRAPGGVVTWTPPALGRWRARASFLGTLRFSPSESGYVQLLVAKPIR